MMKKILLAFFLTLFVVVLKAQQKIGRAHV